MGFYFGLKYLEKDDTIMLCFLRILFLMRKIDSMKHLGQIAIIAGVSLVGELLSFLIPLPVPGSIYGLLLMLLLLVTKLIKLRQA